MPVVDCDGGWWRRETGKKNTVVGGHVGCRSAVHDPGVGPLNRHLVEGGNQAGLIPGSVCHLVEGGNQAGLIPRSVCRGRRELGPTRKQCEPDAEAEAVGEALMVHPTVVATPEESTGRPKGCSKPKGRPAEEPDDRRRRPKGRHAAAGCAHRRCCCRCCCRRGHLCPWPPCPCHHLHDWRPKRWTGRKARCKRSW